MGKRNFSWAPQGRAKNKAKKKSATACANPLPPSIITKMPLASPLRLADAVPTLPRVRLLAGVKKNAIIDPGGASRDFLRTYVQEEKEMRQPEAMVMRGQATRSNSTPYWRVAARFRVITYVAAASSLLLMLVLARLYPDLNRTEIPDWRPLISLADEAANRGDWYGARHLYF